MLRSLLCILAFSAPVLIHGADTSASDTKIPFERVEAIFNSRCVDCHGPEKQKGGFRLDLKEAALEGGDSGKAIVPGKSGQSKIVDLITGKDPEEIMPPKGERLSAEEVAAIKRWIDQGAHWPEGKSAAVTKKSTHWAFQPIVRTQPPRVKDAAWAKNPIDNFVLAGLEAKGVKPSPRANPEMLVRRLHLDLLGLPPGPGVVEAFKKDSSPGAFATLVEQTLESPHFGEQWGRHWLDLARYADTDGYEKDFYRPHAWRWRDWVIQSINQDQPFDQFTIDQIAGDLLPNASLDQKIATGFHRNSLLNREGGVDVEEDRTKIVVDRVSTVGTTWLGLTVGCAECHTHKYDPITQKEFYQLYAFFNSVEERNIRAPLPEERGSVQRMESELTTAKRAYVQQSHPELERWAAKVAKLPEIWFTPGQESYELPTFGANNGANLYHQEDGSFLVTGMVDARCHYVMMLNTETNGITGIRVEVMTDEMLPNLGPGWASGGEFLLSELVVESASLKAVNQLTNHPIASVVADYSQPGYGIERTIDGNHDQGGWSIHRANLPINGVDRCAVYTLKDKLGYDDGMRLKVNLVQHHGRSHTLGRLRVSYTTAAPEQLDSQAVPERVKEIARKDVAARTLDEQVTLKRYYQATFEPEAAEFLAITKAMADAPGIKGQVEAQILAERQNSRPTHVHVRGNFLDRGPRVEPGVLAALHPLKSSSGAKNRKDLAEWLVDPANPLTSRVAVNHIWRHLFGEGLVATVGDFGTQGDKPSHPELLDWLATEFMRLGWSRKELIKLIVNSATYQQASDTRPDLAEIDAKNRWLARQNRFRLNAENTRDQYLAASGLLEPKVGGQSVATDKPRRGLYVQFRRSQPEYMFASFDAPNSTFACPARERSNTPLQALTLMNDPLFLECARKLGAEISNQAGPDNERVSQLFQRTVARAPAPSEVTAALALLEKARAYYQANVGAAGELLGKSREGSDPAQAAWTVVARAALNLDEVIMRE
ncbi:MAG TPA: PSD1 and planctomycete cytochrome C domain-containing protein [Methylomirabilota bacterium]|nr:PSD1 and planctomycete cytochrome C domain-containing protein [Methylomirabilota bacterium]